MVLFSPLRLLQRLDEPLSVLVHKVCLCSKIDRGSPSLCSSLRGLSSTIQLRIDSSQPARGCPRIFHHAAHTNKYWWDFVQKKEVQLIYVSTDHYISIIWFMKQYENQFYILTYGRPFKAWIWIWVIISYSMKVMIVLNVSVAISAKVQEALKKFYLCIKSK